MLTVPVSCRQSCCFAIFLAVVAGVCCQNNCAESDTKCSFYASQEYDAIKWLHAYLDDDKDGEIDPMESAEFLVSELEKNYKEVSSRQTSFHQNDTHISVDELWQIWVHSRPHNWTIDEVGSWLDSIEMTEYKSIFREQEIRGSTLPLIAANWNHFVSTILHIRNPIHKRKLVIKAQDVILFGPPVISTWMTTVLLEILGAFLVVGITFFIYYRRHSRGEIEKLKSELDHLKQAESALSEMQKRLDALHQDASQPSRNAKTPKLEGNDQPVFKLGAPPEIRRLTSVDVDEARREAERLSEERRTTEEKLRRLELAEEELERLRDLLANVEHDMELANGIKHPEVLEQLLISTYQIESKWLESRMTDAQRRMASAREACEKMGRKQSHLFGILRVSHSTLTDVDRTVLEARSALDGVRADVEERLERWSRIEELTGFHILNQQAMDDMHKIVHSSTSALNVRPSLPRGSSSLLRTRPSQMFDTPLESSIDEDPTSTSAASSTHHRPSVTGSTSFSRSSKALLTRESRRDSWLSSDQSGSRDSNNEGHHTPTHLQESSQSTAVVSYSPVLPLVTSASNTPRRRQVP